MKRLNGAPSLFVFPLLATLLLISCAGGLPPSLQREIGDENARLITAEQDLQHSQDRVKQDLAQAPDLFNGAPEPAQWIANFDVARAKLASAKVDSQQLERVRHERGRDVETRARRLLSEERALREAAQTTWKAQEAAAGKWLAFRENIIVWM